MSSWKLWVWRVTVKISSEWSTSVFFVVIIEIIKKKLISKPTNEEFSQVLIINKNIKQNILESTTL